MGLNLATVYVTVRGDSSRIRRDFSSMQGPMAKQASGLGKIVGRAFSAAMMIGGVAGFAGILRMAGTDAVNFEKKMVDVRANARLLGEEGTKSFRLLEGVARELGATTQYTAVQAAQALDRMVLGGLNAREAMEAVPSVLYLAASANMELAESAKVVVDNMRKYGMEAADTGKIADFLSSAQSRAQITASELAQGLSSLGAISSAMNVSFLDTVALLTGMGRAGTEMSRAGTALRTSLARLAKGEAEVGITLEALKVNVRDFVDESGGFRIVELFRAISEALPTDPLERGGMAMKLFGIRASEILGVLNLMREGTFVEETQVGLMNDLGRAAHVTEAKFDVFWGTLKKVRSALGELSIAGLTPVLKAFEPFLEKVKLGTLLLAGFSEGVQKFARDNEEVVRAFVKIVKIVSFAIVIWTSYYAILKAIAITKAIVLALSGPKGWATIAIGSVVAATAIVALEGQFNELAASMVEATEKSKEASDMVNELGNQSSKVDSVTESVHNLTAALKVLKRISEESAKGIGNLITAKASLDKDLARTRANIQETFRTGEETKVAPWETPRQSRSEWDLSNLEKQLNVLVMTQRQIALLEGEFGSLSEAGLFLAMVLEELNPQLAMSALKQDLLDLKEKLLILVEAGRLTSEQMVKMFVAAERKSPLGESVQELKELKEEVYQLREGFGELETAKSQFAKIPFVTSEQKDEFEKLKKELIDLKELKDLKQKWESVLQTPLEKMKAEMAELEKLREAGEISREMFERGKMKVEKEARAGDALLGAGRFGFADFGKQLQDAVLRKDDPQKRIEDNTRRTAKAAEETAAAIKGLPDRPTEGRFAIYAPEL